MTTNEPKMPWEQSLTSLIHLAKVTLSGPSHVRPSVQSYKNDNWLKIKTFDIFLIKWIYVKYLWLFYKGKSSSKVQTEDTWGYTDLKCPSQVLILTSCSSVNMQDTQVPLKKSPLHYFLLQITWSRLLRQKSTAVIIISIYHIIWEIV